MARVLNGWIGKEGAAPNDTVSEAGLIALLIGYTIAEVERDLIIETLCACNGNRTRAAKTLAISVRTLRNKINEYEAKGFHIPTPVHSGSELVGWR
ncbi:helix-turn-helix domain-containing protein [Nitrobacter sp. Nb-311A]|uniref:helix-turn-helix domain-containing protein n=1 Tax=Nitrobacter sp. Nb-311A TaxID=314253 RepID=UPI0006831EBD